MHTRLRMVIGTLLAGTGTVMVAACNGEPEVDWEERAIEKPGVRALAEMQPPDDTTAPAVDTSAAERTPAQRESCTSEPGMVERLDGDPRAINAQQLRNYVRRLCFGNAPASGADSAEAERGRHPTLGRLLLFAPEKRMLAFHPESLRAGQGAVVAAVENYDSDSLRVESWGAGRLRAEQEGFLWYGRNADNALYVVFFKFVRRGTGPPLYAEIARGTWEHQRDTTLGLRARWNHPEPVGGSAGATGGAALHAPPSPFVRTAFAADLPGPPASLRLTAAVQSSGGGWISCLRGCCKTSGVFAQ